MHYTGAMRLLLITGLPATGKSTLARAVARRLHAPLIGKDAIKEPLLECLGAADAAASRRLSDASFAAMFRLTTALVEAGVPTVLEGNFRPGEHEGPLRQALGARALDAACLAQVLCRVPEPERQARLAARVRSGERHPGHRDADLLLAEVRRSDAFLDLPGSRFVYDAPDLHALAARALLESLERWWRQ